ncbi:uncharacterized protein MONBRDRAFT_11191 [Monosiga brevicollis MX1]|uniref:Uncharacterized protein n=1 Tax=Monosiga brevicollis TaxID=81824 RepID=A9V8G9_MONBE|nr:uncharacterized protein MONBRDRAFT_11191 [Monosiga brevicollis MX1]EDQ86081.1 predicted protein [Monosiga brevicollis MX1]|eukprot:XP_001749006.1 hypothetical protein [Monosiga brevicollis MX1]
MAALDPHGSGYDDYDAAYDVEDEGAERRPMTAIKGAGFSSSKGRSSNFDPMATDIPAPLEKTQDTSPEANIRNLEAKVHDFLEESSFAVSKRKFQEVLVQLANVYQFCEMYTESINTLMVLVKNKTFDRAGRLRVNIGNIYFKQGKHLQAVKQYRMSLDQIPSDQQQLKNRVLKNIAHCFVKMGQYADAMKTYEHVLEQTPIRVHGDMCVVPATHRSIACGRAEQEMEGMEEREPGNDFQTAFNCILCYVAIGERDRMKRGFIRMLSLQLDGDPDGDKYLNVQDDSQVQMFLDAVKDDQLRGLERRAKKHAERYLLLAARLIAPLIESDFADGFDWCIEKIKASAFNPLASELEIHKALSYLKVKEFKKAVKLLKGFEKKESHMLSTAATNLAFLYALETDYTQAEEYADRAIQADKYNPNAMVNKGNCLLAQDKHAEAIEFYHEALAVDSGCFEALYNLGLAHRRLGDLDEALDCFLKLADMLPEHAEVVYQVAAVYEELEDFDQSCEWFETLIGLVRTDPNALRHFGELYDKLEDKSEAFKYHFEAFRYFPSDIATISWFGSYYIESQFIEKAIQYFERAAEVQPGQVKWRLMIGSCYRRTGNYQQALEVYKRTHRLFPDNVECLKFLVRICTDMDLPEAQDFAVALKRAEQMTERKRSATTRANSGRRTRSGRTLGHSASKARASSGTNSLSSSTNAFPADAAAVDAHEAEVTPKPQALDASYKDPIGQMPNRPKTAAQRSQPPDEENWDDIDDDLLPD